MRHVPSWILASAILVLGTTPARPAEKGKLVPEEGALQVMLLRQKAVREALHLTDREATRIHEFTARQWKRAQEVDRLGEAESERQFTEMTRENERFLDEILKPDQRKRLEQITLQVAGLLWVTRPHIARQLRLTDEQIQRARQLQEEARKEVHELVHSRGIANKEEKMKELRATSRKRLMTLLTDEQEARWKEMTGEPFEAGLLFEKEEQQGGK